MIRVVAPSRLHFGLFHVPVGGAEGAERAFGGVGLMIDRPGVVVVVRPAESWQFEGPLASRAQVFAARFMASLPEGARRPFQVLVERSPPEHTGLGVGTQLGLAVAKALAVACGEPELPSAQLAVRVGRGERSAIGVHGFDRGGLLADAGKRAGEAVSPLLAHVTVPDEWRVVLFLPRTADLWHTDRERAAFAAASPGEPDTLRRIAETAILPAAEGGDLEAFGEAVYEFNQRAGEPFAAAQGGVYASPEIASLIADVRECGVAGVGQSSWGPTVFAVVGGGDAAVSLLERFRGRAPAFVSRVSVGGHAVQCDPPAGD
ncbi:MAG: beta-RFAP synthase [Planctomycetes bacterium]|nr:beta-RFAP synthase [Planctomycetota bacterium]